MSSKIWSLASLRKIMPIRCRHEYRGESSDAIDCSKKSALLIVKNRLPALAYYSRSSAQATSPSQMSAEPKVTSQHAIIAAVQLPSVSDEELQSSLIELRELAKTLGFEVVGTFTQKRANFDSGAYLGAGKREEIRRFVQGEVDEAGESPEEPRAEAKRATNNAERRTARHGALAAREAAKSLAGTDARRAAFLLVDHEISPSQARNLENEIGCDVMDRTMVILEIFHRHARSKAARAQVEIARLRYLAPRLREAAKLAGPQGRQRSGVGGRGAGEGAGEADRAKIRDRIAELKQEIIALDLERQTQRARRQERQGLARVALVGYTNAGKSTLMRALTGSEVLVANKLFATLDTTVRTLVPEGVPRVLVSDTVGFIKNLPHDLVASFKSTLEEAAEASLLLHVIDASDPGFERQIEVTDKVLEEIDAGKVPRLRVFNKIDMAGDARSQKEIATYLRAQFPKCIVMSAVDKDDIARLQTAIRAFFGRRLVKAELFLPWSAQQLRGELFAVCQVLEERAGADGAHFTVRAERKDLEVLRERIGQAPGVSRPFIVNED
jgi:GTP-binding protein HflX